MQDNFSAEIGLVNQIRVKLVDDGWSIIQLVCSGGQAHFSISYAMGGRLKNIYPDIVAFNDKNILIGEIKEKFDKNDYLKLLELKSSGEGLKKLLKSVSLRTGESYQIKNILFYLVHSQAEPSPVRHIHQFAYSNGGFRSVLPE
jgi:Holliday junction resolvase